MPAKWDRGRPEQIFAAGLDAYEKSVWQSLQAIAAYFVPQIENWMKENAPWTDRSSNARQALYADFMPMIEGVWIYMDHGMDYGYWLEIAHTGKYGIIRPALDHFGPLIWQAVLELFVV